MSLSTFFESRNKANTNTKEVKPLFVIPKEQPVLINKVQTINNKNIKELLQKTLQNNHKVKSKPITPDDFKEEEKENLQATIFVGNVNLNTKNKDLIKHFTKYGKIEKAWFRSIPVQQNKIGKKASHILKKYKQGADSMNAYVKFQKIQQAKAACQQNGSIFNQLTIRVTMCLQKDIDFKSTIFVGNLPHQVKQEEVRKHFQNIGKILSVRVIKNKFTNQGIGIGYVHFQTVQEMKKAINELHGSLLNGRDLRVKRAVQKQRLEKKFNKINSFYQRKGQANPKLKQKKKKFIQQRVKRRQIKQNRKMQKLNKANPNSNINTKTNKTKAIKK